MERISAWSLLWKHLRRVGGFIGAVVTRLRMFIRSNWKPLTAAATLIGSLIAFWLTGGADRLPFVPPAPRAVLAIKNVFKGSALPDTARFRLVLTWLEDGPDGKITRDIERVFFDIGGIDLVRSARMVKKGGAAAEWNPAVLKRVRPILDKWAADVAIIGGGIDEESVELHFVSYSKIEGGRYFWDTTGDLANEIRDDLSTRLAVAAFSAVAPRANSEARSQVLKDQMESAVSKIEKALDDRIDDAITPISKRERASLHVAHGNALQTLGEREPGTARLEEAVSAYEAALTVRTRENEPVLIGAVVTRLRVFIRSNWKTLRNLMGAVLALIVFWLRGWADRLPFVPSAPRVGLAIKNVFKGSALPDPKFFRLVLTWLEDDPNGKITRDIEQVFSNIGNIDLVRSARMVKEGGAADQWKPAVLKRVRPILDKWAADVAIIGGGIDEESVELHFVSYSKIEGGRYFWDTTGDLANEIRDDLSTRLAVAAFSAVAPRANSEARSQVLKDQMESAVSKIEKALDDRIDDAITPISKRERAFLHIAHGTALLFLGERKHGTARLEKAVSAYEAAFTVWTHENEPLRWAWTQNNLGIALGILGEREPGTARLEEAVSAFEAAFTVLTREKEPLDWAGTQNNLGVALQILGKREPGTARLEKAVSAFEAAFTVWTRENEPLAWAGTQNNLGVALRILGEREPGTARLEKAVSAYDSALTVWTREKEPLDWAGTQNNLGVALRILGEREPGTARLEKAVRAYEAAFTVWTHENEPLRWARTQNNLGNVLQTLGEREHGTARLEKAVSAYEAALTVRTHENEPLRWARTQNNLGVALQTLGQREPGTARLEKAVRAYEAALTVCTRENEPFDWAGMQHNLGNALGILGGQEHGTARLKKAVRAYEAALTVWTREHRPLDWARTQNNLGDVLRILGEREHGTARLKKAVRAYEAALTVWTRENEPLAWAGTQNNLGVALQTLGQREPGTARLEKAVSAYEAALTVWTREKEPLDWARTQSNLGYALGTLGEREPGTARLEKAVRAYEAALDIFRVHDPSAADSVTSPLKLLEAMIKERLG